MRRRVKTWLLIFAIVASLGCVTTDAKAAWNAAFEDLKGRGEQESDTPDEARERGILVAAVVADPGEVEIPGGRIRFGRAWVEERSLPTHCFVWLPAERRRGGYRLHFTAQVIGGNESPWPFAVLDDAGHGQPLVPDDTRVYYLPIESTDVRGVRLSVLQSWKDVRAKNIRFLPLR
jgi:hypothetical protein